MKKLYSFFILVLLAVATAQAQRARFEISFTPALEGEAKVYVQPRVDGEAKSTALRLKDGLYVGNIPFSGTGFYDASLKIIDYDVVDVQKVTLLFLSIIIHS